MARTGGGRLAGQQRSARARERIEGDLARVGVDLDEEPGQAQRERRRMV